ncbi:MAG: hypothetical protein ACI8RZ_002236 [Myxococcota bacterium]|jgi:hypothetical protein
MLWPVLLTAASAEGPWHLDATLGTDFPISVGTEVTAETSRRFRGKFGVGYYPQPYLDVLNGVAVSAEWWDEETATLIDAALSGALVTGASVGWRPWEHRRFSFGVGYQLIALGGGLTDEEALQGVTGVEVSTNGDQSLEATVAAQLHQITVEASWQWTIKERWLLSAQVGGLSTLYSNTTVEVLLNGPSGPGDEAVEASLNTMETYGEDYLDGIFQKWVHTGTIGLYAGYRFF